MLKLIWLELKLRSIETKIAKCTEERKRIKCKQQKLTEKYEQYLAKRKGV